MNKLTPEQQKVFKEVGRQITDKAYAVSADLEAKYFADMKTRMKINEVNLPKFQAATKASYQNYIDAVGDDYLKIIEAAR